MTYTHMAQKACRDAMVAQMQEIANNVDATLVENTASSLYHTVSIYGPKGLGVMLGIPKRGRNLHPQDYDFMLHWFVKPTETAKLSAQVFSDVNPFHRQKATQILRGFDDVLAAIGNNFQAAVTGAAFEQSSQTS